MTNVPGATTVLWLALAGALVGAAMGAWRQTRDRLRSAVMLGAVGSLVASIGARQYWYLTLGNLNLVDWFATLGVAAAGWIFLVFALRGALCDHDPVAAPPGGIRLLRERTSAVAIPTRVRWTSLLRLLLLLCAGYVSLGLAFAGRHRDFPVWLFLPGVLALVIGALQQARAHGVALRRDRAIEETLLACWLLVAAAMIPAIEHFGNLDSAAWGLSMLATALAILIPVGLQAAGQQQATQHADT
jgi:hypothetical protein